VWEASGVVEATVASIETMQGPPMSENGPSIRERLVRLQDVRTVTGESTDVVATGFGGGDCGYDFRVGTRYLIVTHKRPTDGRATTSICSPTQPAAWSSPLKSYFENVSRPSPGATLSGTVRLRRGSTDLSGLRNEPVPGVRVLLDGPVQQRVESNRNGEFKFARLPAGDYTLTAEPPAGRMDLLPIPPRKLTLPNTHTCASVGLTTAVNRGIEGELGAYVAKGGTRKTTPEAPGQLKGYLETLSRPSPRATISSQIQAWKGPGRAKIGLPLPGVELVLTGPVRQTIESDAKGAFAFERLPVGEYLLTPEMPPGRPDLMPLRPVAASLPHTHACSSLSLIALSSSQPFRSEPRRD